VNDDDEFMNEGGAPRAVQGPDSWFSRDDQPAAELDLPHWTEPGTGEIPALTGVTLAEDDPGRWSALGSGPRWRDGAGDYDDSDDIRLLQGMSQEPPPVGQVDNYGFDDGQAGTVGTMPMGAASLGGGPSDGALPPIAPVPIVAPDASLGSTTAPPSFEQGLASAPPPAARGPVPASAAPAPTGGADRNLGLAVGTGLALGIAAILALWLGELFALGLVTILLLLASLEFFNAVRQVGYQPAVLVGAAATAGLPLATYWRGPVAYPVVLFLAMVFSMMWYLFAVTKDRPVPNLAITSLGIGYIAVLGSFAALMLWSDSVNANGVAESKGTGLLFAAILLTVAYDVGAYFFGRAFGRSKLSSVSPNKTVEGLVGGFVLAIVIPAVVLSLLDLEPWAGDGPGGFSDLVVLGIVGAAAATLGDLCESMIKRDLGLKDMGTMLPGHGGILDRFDSLLFVLPATWCAAVVLGVAEPLSL